MTSNIKITFLGTASAVPTKERNHSSILVSYADENILIDCGEGTQRQFRKAKLSPMRLTRILITHWHGDHVLGIPGLLQTLTLNGYNKTLEISGPKGTKKFMRNLLKTFVFTGKIKLKITEIDSDKKILEKKDIIVEANKVFHGIPALSYNIIKKGQIRIDKMKLKQTGLPHGKFLHGLKQGKNIQHKGKTYFAKDLTYKENEKKISVILDTGFDNRLISYAKNADLLIIESSFSSELKNKEQLNYHLTSSQSATIAKKANVKKLILTHLSQRYETENEQKKILNEAREVFKKTFIANDFDKIEI